MKKKFLSIPAILLLLLLFVLYGTSYAINSTDIITAIEEINEVADTTYSNQLYGTIQNVRCQNVLQYIDEHDYSMYNRFSFYEVSNWGYGTITMWHEDTNSYYYRQSNLTDNNNGILIDTATNVCKITMAYNKQTSGTYKNYYIDTITTTNTQLVTTGSNSASNTTILNIDKPIYVGTGLDIIWSFDILDYYNYPYDTESLLYYDPDPTDTNVNVDIFEDIPAYTYNVAEDITIGILYIPINRKVTNLSIIRGYYTGDYWKYIEVTTQTQNSYIYYTKYREYEDYIAWEVKLNRQNIQQNNIYIITWSDQTEEPYQNATATLYIKNGQTIIVDGEVMPSGDNITGAIGELQEDINNNNDFWKETYDKLFKIPSGDAEKIIENFLESSNLKEYGLESGELAILNSLNGEPSDFVISWNSVVIPNLKDNTPTQLVPAGNINFSKLQITLGETTYTGNETRVNQILFLMSWVQTILGFAVILLTIANVWETLMRALGIGVGMYEDNAEEKETLMNIDVDSGEIRTTEIRRVPTQRYTYFLHRKH